MNLSLCLNLPVNLGLCLLPVNQGVSITCEPGSVSLFACELKSMLLSACDCVHVHVCVTLCVLCMRYPSSQTHSHTHTLSQLFTSIGNERANVLLEKHCHSERIAQDSPREIRDTFIRAKYESKAWIPRNPVDTPDVLNKVGVVIT